MKIQVYEGKEVITLESVCEYVFNSKDVEACKNWFYKRLGKDNGILLKCHEATAYGQKNFNYARGLWIYNIEAVLNLVKSNNEFLDLKFDRNAFLSDVEKGDIRALNCTPPKRKKPVKIKEEVISDTQPEITPINNDYNQSPFEELYALVDRMNENTIRVLTENNQKLEEQINSLTEKVNSLSEQLERKIEETSDLKSCFETPIILKENSSFKEWNSTVKRACDLIIQLDPKQTQTDILHSAYDRIRSQYGIVWEQEAKEFKEEYNRSPISTRELCWWMETTKSVYKNLLIGKLNTIYSEKKRGIA